MYYIIYEDDSDFETVVVQFEEPRNVITFVEEKINRHNYGLDDFKVVHGTEIGLKTVKTPIKILLTN